MATLIPALSACVARMTSGERRLAERLEAKLDADYLLWFDVPVGPRQSHPDFVVLHPRRGLLILEVKDWRLATIARADKSTWDILPGGDPKTVDNPIEQARHYALEVVDALKRDPPLVQADGRHQGKLRFPWSFGVVFSHITRKQFTDAGLDQAIAPNRVVCSDEMTEAVDPEEFQSRLWDMFPYDMLGGALSLPQIDRVRWILFPEVRVPEQATLLTADDDADLPGIMRVMDIQQEQLARSLGDGHRVIHGVAGSGKTMILGYRAEYLARGSVDKPILVLCFNKALAAQLEANMAAKGLVSRVHVRNFHQWCRQQLLAYGQSLPPDGEGFFDALVQNLIRAVERQQIPSGQYQAVLIDEGHDFAAEWLKLVVQMVDPLTNSLLMLYDDAQSLYKTRRKLKFTLKSVGIKAQGTTTILKINYRNTRQVLRVASLIAADLLHAEDADEDGIPRLQPLSCGRDGPEPLVLRLPSLRDEARQIADLLAAAHQEGHAWGDMVVLCRHTRMLDDFASALRHRQLPCQVCKASLGFQPQDNRIQLMTMHASKGLEFAVVALPGVGQMPHQGEDEREEARLFYVAATRATHKLLITVSGDGSFGQRLAPLGLQSN